jgi:hypothetical protein
VKTTFGAANGFKGPGINDFKRAFVDFFNEGVVSVKSKTTTAAYFWMLPSLHK